MEGFDIFSGLASREPSENRRESLGRGVFSFPTDQSGQRTEFRGLSWHLPSVYSLNRGALNPQHTRQSSRHWSSRAVSVGVGLKADILRVLQSERI